MKVEVDFFDYVEDEEYVCFIGLHATDEKGPLAWEISRRVTYYRDEFFAGISWKELKEKRLGIHWASDLKSEFDFSIDGEILKPHEIKQVIEVLREKQAQKLAEADQLGKEIGALAL